ncbi:MULTISPECIES: 16S rRNA (uracil(1498)-N(3))-methyltransferase [unclassified Halomonas]|uniref:16S rRNA (uracil(1498)-N(3))-methyltransferase n=1 Tax=unclassified Halomonas TaxID=2609666 RepID=UPI0006D9716C|nr:MULTISPECIES: 16S rRNA (uracil(1498)-N(3))-methyltransferase [unclassified Halomonas]KPQ20328.1 MAG: 16S rRNA (uracil1498-N3)-methyltransferase RsmE [Halomonas sp. HL-93]SBR52421.1 16S rRNA m(3)U-1498 methyltransferase [Halomonas sp. HL-93]SNY98020.1 16S rRNA m(3)U-1498 methyltransferase [Halomonas sp. hl-4]
MRAADWYALHGKMPRLYVPLAFSTGDEVVLPEGPARHVTRVLRLTENAPLVLFDGQGHEAGVRLVEASRKRTVARVDVVWPGSDESPLAVHLGQAISKGDRMDYAIQKAVELGVSAITPLYTERCDVRLKGDREEKKLAHWQAVAASACEQSGRAVVPPVNSPVTLQAWLDERQEPLRLMLHLATGHPFDRELSPEAVALLIGPEGGLSDTDIAAASAADFTPLTLGPRVLRTETAPIVALTLLQHYFGDL